MLHWLTQQIYSSRWLCCQKVHWAWQFLQKIHRHISPPTLWAHMQGRKDSRAIENTSAFFNDKLALPNFKFQKNCKSGTAGVDFFYAYECNTLFLTVIRCKGSISDASLVTSLWSLASAAKNKKTREWMKPESTHLWIAKKLKHLSEYI